MLFLCLNTILVFVELLRVLFFTHFFIGVGEARSVISGRVTYFKVALPMLQIIFSTEVEDVGILKAFSKHVSCG